MMILALCTIVLFVIVASLIEAWLAKARKAKSEVDTLPSGPEASQRSVEKSEAVEQAVDNAGGFDLDERRKARAPKSIPDRRPWFFKTVMGRGLVCLLTKVIPILYADDPIRIIHRSLIFDTQLKVMLTPERPHGSLMAEWPAMGQPDLTLKVNGIKRALSPLVEIDGCAGMPGVFI